MSFQACWNVPRATSTYESIPIRVKLVFRYSISALQSRKEPSMLGGIFPITTNTLVVAYLKMRQKIFSFASSDTAQYHSFYNLTIQHCRGQEQRNTTIIGIHQLTALCYYIFPLKEKENLLLRQAIMGIKKERRRNIATRISIQKNGAHR